MGRIVTTVVSALVLASCGGTFLGFGGDLVGSGTSASETREVDAFDAIRLDGVGRVSVTIGDEASVVVETDDNLVDRVVTDVRAGTLVVDIENGITIAPRSGLTITVTTPTLRAIGISGAGSIDVAAAAVDSFEIDVRGAGSVDVGDLTADTLTVSHSGAGSITVAGEVQRAVVDLSGVGDYDGGDLRAGAVEVTAAGVGSVEVWAVDSLDIQASGVGSVSYWGQPSMKVESTGLGDIEALGDR